MAEDLKIFGTNFNTVNALRVTTQSNTQILYTTGSGQQLLLQNKTVTPATFSQDVEPDDGYYGLSKVVVDPISSSYIIPSGTYNISHNGTFNVTQYAAASVNITFTPNNQAKTAAPTSTQQVISADSGYDGLSTVTISAVSLQNKTVAPSSTQQTVIAESNYNGLGTVTVNAVSLQNKTITPTTAAQSITADAGYNGLGTVTVTMAPTQTKSVTPTKSTQTVNPDSAYVGLSTVTVDPIPSNYIDTTDATATENDILYGETAYVNTQKITGTLAISRLYEGVEAPSNNMGNIGDMYIQVG